jgi:hypothetical protein
VSARALRRIEADLMGMAKDPDTMTRENVKLAAIRIAAQAEMIEEGINE